MVEDGIKCFITVSQGETTLEVKDVLFGDVWVCSGKDILKVFFILVQ